MSRPSTAIAAPADAHLLLLTPPGRLVLAAGDPEPTWEIGKPGRWFGVFGPIEITPDILAQLAASYDPVSVQRSALNFDHAFGGPAQGWIEDVFLEGDVLKARLSKLSPEVVAGVQAERWQHVSMELDPNNAISGGWYLDGLALLGSRPPAVKGLRPVSLTADRVYVQLSTGAPAPPTDAPDAGAQEEDDMGKQNPAQAAGGAPATPVASDPPVTTSTAPAVPETPVATTNEQPTADVQLAAANEAAKRAQAALDSARQIELRARRREARADVEEALRPLRDSIPPAVLRSGIGDLLVELRAAEAPFTVKLAGAKQGDAEREVSAYDVVLAALKSIPSTKLLGSEQLAGADAEDASPRASDRRTPEQRKVDLARGINDERSIALQQKYPGSFA